MYTYKANVVREREREREGGGEERKLYIYMSSERRETIMNNKELFLSLLKVH